MRWKPSSLDDEIHAVERCIASDRRLLEQAFVGYVDGVRDSALHTMASPKFLLGALGVGFVIGKFLFRPRKASRQNEATAKRSVLGLLGAGTLSLVQAQFGGPLGLARWLAKTYASRRPTQRMPAAPPQPAPVVHAQPAVVATPAGEEPAVLLRR
ncbi:MAG TPA: hypothetical protein VKZ48_01105 [Burkholderiales bacterium]|nr:hypothetical protein [Burkholderiales bacterium]